MRKVLVLPLTIALLVTITALVGAATDTSVRVNAGSPPAPFSQNKQNEPALAVNAHQPNVLVAGANDNIDMEACNAGNDTTCPFTNGVGVSGVYFSFDSGKTWTQPTYTGWTARGCLGTPGNADPACQPQVGPIGTLPWYYENGLVSDGDPAVAFGPKPGANGAFSWSNGSRLYYANLSSNFGATRSEEAFKGFEAIAVSRTDDVVAAAAGNKDAWMNPVIVSKQSSTTFSDKEQIWADNASSSPFFGTVYICWADFRGQELSPNAAPAPLQVAVSHDGGATWRQNQIGAAANNRNRNPMDGCTIRTDSNGNAYLYGIGRQGPDAFEIQSISSDGGTSWSKPQPVAGPVTQPGIIDPVLGRPTIDGIAGARSDLAPAPSVDIANGAPTGANATNRIVMTYVSGEIAAPHVYFTESTDGGTTWLAPRAIETSGDRGYYTAPSISPNGKDVYVVYNAFTTPYRTNTTDPRSLVGVFLHADAAPGTGPTGGFAELTRGTAGDPRGSSQNNLVGEFLGDYVYAVATDKYGAAVWNDARNDADCPAIDAWRMSLRNGTTVTRPAPQQDCAPTFGNSEIFGVSVADPTP
ncbi:MAG: exo-alpha-sialidase [Chloroflexi bacterium]|nr:MAG: exo-alpha-sialidase [Chloroflexota bacterium]HKC90558.1 sialidase family protein [Candidatus Limnocylindria bacterium]